MPADRPHPAVPSSLVGPWALLVLMLLPAAAYINSLGHGFVHDDRIQIIENRAIRSLDNIGRFWRGDVAAVSIVGGGGESASAERGPHFDRRVCYWRPVFLTSYALDYWLWGVEPRGYHLTNLLMHVAVTVLVFRLFLALATRTTAWLAALLFSVHPVNSEAVNWVAARVELLCAIFLIAAFLSYVRWRCGAGGIASWLTSVLFYGLGLLSWEAAVSFPLVLTARELTDPYAARAGRHRVVSLATYGLVTVAYLMVRTAIVGSPPVLTAALDLRTTLFVGAMTVFDYARLLVVPVALSAAYPIPSSVHIADPRVVAGMVLALALVVGTALGLKRVWQQRPGSTPRAGTEALFWVLWIWALLLPAFNIGGFGGNRLAERYLYISSVGYSVLMAEIVVAWWRRLQSTPLRWLPVGAATVIVCLFTVMTVQRNAVWRDDATFYTYGVADAPQSALMRNDLGNFLQQQGRYAEAAAQLRQAVALSPRYAEAHLNLSIVYGKMGDMQQALAHVAMAREIEPAWAEPWFQQGELLRGSGDVAGARAAWTEAVELDPRHSRACNNLGNVCRLDGDLRCALGWYRRALAADANNAEAYYNLASAAAAIGAIDEAIANYERFAELGRATYPQAAAVAEERARALRAQGSAAPGTEP